MSPFFRHLVACLMFVLLPFQALATDPGACANAMDDCAEMMMQADCCDHGASDDSSPDSTHKCASAEGCMSAFAIAIPAEIRQTPPSTAAGDTAPGSLTIYRSFIPRALQRPPRLIC